MDAAFNQCGLLNKYLLSTYYARPGELEVVGSQHRQSMRFCNSADVHFKFKVRMLCQLRQGLAYNICSGHRSSVFRTISMALPKVRLGDRP